MTEILTHRGLDPSRPDYFSESSYEAFEDQLLRGFGLEIDIQFTKDGRAVILHDRDLARTSGGSDTRKVAELTLAELRATPLPNGHIAYLDEILSLAYIVSKRPGKHATPIALHVKHHEQEQVSLDLLLAHLAPFDTSSLIIFDLAPAAAAYLKKRCPKLALTASVADSYDIERYGSTTGNTLLSIDELIAHKDLYAWAWLDEWDTRAKDDSSKKLYSQEVFSQLRAHGFKIALVMPELHATSPGLLGGESHEDARTHESLSKRWKEIVALKPDAICTDYPDQVAQLIPRKPEKQQGVSITSIVLNITKNIVQKAERKIGQFLTFHMRPIRVEKMITWRAEPLPNNERCAIVIQGPICLPDDFTLETIKIYKNMFNDPIIILSTWTGEDEEYIREKIIPLGAEVILNEKPSYPGVTNINSQIVSTHAGIERAHMLGAEYVMKTRADQRIYERNVIEFVLSQLSYFPVSKRSGQKKRLAFVHGLPKFAPYQFADLWMFGHIDDMREYWSVPQVTQGTESTFFVSEVYLATSYLKRKGWKLDWTTEQLWEIYRECVVPIDWYMLDLYWPKYIRHREHKDRIAYSTGKPNADLLRYSEWFIIVSNPDKKPPVDANTFVFRGRMPLKIDQYNN